jgi:hypothetical protein
VAGAARMLFQSLHVSQPRVAVPAGSGSSHQHH